MDHAIDGHPHLPNDGQGQNPILAGAQVNVQMPLATAAPPWSNKILVQFKSVATVTGWYYLMNFLKTQSGYHFCYRKRLSAIAFDRLSALFDFVTAAGATVNLVTFIHPVPPPGEEEVLVPQPPDVHPLISDVQEVQQILNFAVGPIQLPGDMQAQVAQAAQAAGITPYQFILQALQNWQPPN